MATDRPIDLVTIVTTEASRLRGILSHLDAQTWASDSTSEGWTIEDVVAHLAGNIDNWTSNLTRAVAGNFSPPEGQAFLPPRARASHPTGATARESRRLSASQILDVFDEGHERFQMVLETLLDEDWDKPCFHRRGIVTASVFVGLQVQELALHGWDICRTLDDAAELSEISLPVLTDLVPRWIDTAFMPNLDLPAPMTFRFDVSDPMPVHQDLLINSCAYEMVASTKESADVTFRCDTGNYVLMMYGRLEVERAIADGRLLVEGSVDRAKHFNTWFKGF